MKTILALLIVANLASARAQQEPPITPAQPLPPVAPKRIEKTVNDTLRGALGVAEEAVANSARLAQRAATAAAQNAEVQFQDLNNFTVYPTGSGTSRGNRSLVIQTSEPDPVANANAEED